MTRLDDYTAEGCSNSAAGDDIAIIGMALRFADNVDSTQALWDYLLQKGSAMSPFPSCRWNQAAHSGHSGSNMLPQKGAHFMNEDPSAFDGPFFSISPLEIASMDPQQRMSLECSYQALENAGLSLSSVAGTDTSVYVGGSSHDYENQLARDPDLVQKYRATGTNMGLLANRVSWFYDFNGPSMTIDTACSSTMNAIHLACQSIKSGESSMSLVGGANIILQVDAMMALHSLGMLSHNSISRSFDEGADGFARGEGCGFVVLKRFSDAVRDGNTLRAVIRASCANQDGHTPSIVQPSSKAQMDLIRLAYKDLDIGATRYFESHGTGTRLGDSLEANAIISVFNPTTERPLFVGASKSNFGHLEGASGILSVIKTVLVLEHGIIPPNAFFDKPNSQIIAAEAHLRFPKEPVPWPNKGLRRASINSFGFGGSNAHLVLDDALHYLKSLNIEAAHSTIALPSIKTSAMTHVEASALKAYDYKSIDPQLLVWSAADKDGVDRYGNLLATSHQFVASYNADQEFITDLAYTLIEKRSHLAWRSFTLASDLESSIPGIGMNKIPVIKAKEAPNLIFIFTGQGANWATMGKQLKVYPIFAQSLLQAQAQFQKLGATWSLDEELALPKHSSRLHHPELSQPICTAIQIALVDLLRDWGVLPHVVVGHSSGEIAAAYCMGAISQISALTIAYYRGAAVGTLSEVQKYSGGMMAVGLSEEKAREYIAQLFVSDQKIDEHKLSIACINSYNSVTISGSLDYLEALQSVLEKQSIFCRRLRISVAYHSQAMQDISQLYHKMIGSLEKGNWSEELPMMISTVTAKSITRSELREPEYWVQNLVSPVLFRQAIAQLQLGPKKTTQHESHDEIFQTLPSVDLIVEIGPHSALKGPLQNIFATTCPGTEFSYISLLLRDSCGLRSILEAAGMLFQRGVEFDIDRVNSSRLKPIPRRRRMLVNLPPYAFNHINKYWTEGRLSKNYRFRRFPPHELLGHQVIDWNSSAARWQNFISLSSHPWVEHHKIAGAYIYPGAGTVAMAIEAARQLNTDHEIDSFRFRDVSIVKALVIPKTGSVEIQFSMEKHLEQNDPSSTWYTFKLFLHEESTFVQLSYGTIGVNYKPQSSNNNPSQSNAQYSLQSRIAQNCWKKVSHEAFYKLCMDHGLQYGDSFCGLDQIFMDNRHFTKEEQHFARATVDLDYWKNSIDGTKYQPHVIHPAALDAVIQLPIVALSWMDHGFLVVIPTQFKDLWISSSILDNIDQTTLHPRQTKLDVFSQSEYTGFRNASVEMVATDPRTGDVVLKCHGSCTTVDDRRLSSSTAENAKALCYSLEWRPDLDIATATNIQKYCSVNAIPKVVETDEVIIQLLALGYFCAQRALRDVDSMILSEQSSKYISFLKHCLDNIDSELEPEHQIKLSHENDNEEFFLNLCNSVEKLNPEGRLLSRVARNIKQLLLDQVDVIEFLFSDNLMQEWYQHCIDADAGFWKFRKWLDAYVHKHPSCNLLEVGAGTGAASKHILEFLSESSVQRFEKYMFTDVSAGFFSKARDALSKYEESIQFATLDIENDPAAQDHKTAYYDIVIASNVLHATKDIRTTLRNVRSLLKSDGKLIMVEVLGDSGLFPSILTGFFPGWWTSTESERSMGPTLSEAQWNMMLLETGFTGIDISFHGYRRKKHFTSTMISSAREVTVPKPISSIVNQPIWIVITPQSTSQARLALELQRQIGSTCIIEQLKNIPRTLDAEYTIFLESLEEDVLQTATDDSFSNLISVLSNSRNFLWVYSTQLLTDSGPVNEGIAGFARSVMTEQPDNKVRLLGLNSSPDTLDDSIEGIVGDILRVKEQVLSTSHNDHQLMYVEKEGMLHINRLQTLSELDNFIFDQTNPRPSQPTKLGSQCLRVSIATQGSLDTLQFVNDTVQDEGLGEDEILISVKACGLNFKDLLLALGKMDGYLFGHECSGVVAATGSRSPFMKGDRVSCFFAGTMATHARCKSACAVRMPSWMSYSQGAGWAMSFMTAYNALVLKAQISKGERILIHSGAGALGQACIQIAKMHGAEIFTTVGNSDKAQFLTDRYGILPDHIFDSRSSRFEREIMVATEDKGVDVIVNSLSGELLQASWRCIGSFGRFIETGKRDIKVANSIPLSMFEKNISFFALDLSHIAEHKDDLLNSMLTKVMGWLNEGKIHILDTVVYPFSKMEQGFRDLSTGNTMGKIVLELSSDDTVMAIPPTYIPWRFPAEATYVIVGGLGGLGRSLARWMSRRGATHLVLLSRKGASDEEARDLITELERMGTQVAAPACNVSIAADVKNMLAETDNFPPIRGCIQGAMVLDNISINSMSLDIYEKVVKPKIKGTWNLHQLLPSGMDFFVMLSSISGIVGMHGQANYASASTYLDGLAKYRKMQGENAVSLDIGKILQVGYVAEGKGMVNQALMDLFPGILERELHALLEFYCQPLTNNINHGPGLKQSQVIIGIDSPDMFRAQGHLESLWYMEQALFRQLTQVKAQSSVIQDEHHAGDISVQLAKAETREAVVGIVVQGFATKLERTLGLTAQDFDESNALRKYGIDSLTAVEIRTWLRTSIGANVPVFDLVSDKSIAELASQAVSISSFVPASFRTASEKVNGVSA